MSLTPIQQVRLNIQDNTPGLYIISDDELEYILNRNSGNVTRASMDAARIILMNLSMRGDETVDILSIKGSSAAAAYKQALMLYIKDPNLNPLYNNLNMWVGGVSKTEIAANNANVDNKYVQSLNTSSTTESIDGFSI